MVARTGAALGQNGKEVPLVKLPDRIVVKRGARNLETADHRNSTAAPSQVAQALAPPLASVLSLRSNSRLGIPGEPALIGATSYKLQAASTRDPFYALGRVDDHCQLGHRKSQVAAVITVQEASH